MLKNAHTTMTFVRAYGIINYYQALRFKND